MHCILHFSKLKFSFHLFLLPELEVQFDVVVGLHLWQSQVRLLARKRDGRVDKVEPGGRGGGEGGEGSRRRVGGVEAGDDAVQVVDTV